MHSCSFHSFVLTGRAYHLGFGLAATAYGYYVLTYSFEQQRELRAELDAERAREAARKAERGD